jgi:hypothetical protein
MMALPRPPEKDSHEAHWGWLEFQRDDANPHVTEAERLVLCAQAERHGWTDEQLLSVAHHVADLAQGYDEKRDERSARLDERASILAGEVPDPRDAGWYEAQGGVQAPYTIVGREAWEQAAPGGRAPAQTPEPAVPGGPHPEPAVPGEPPPEPAVPGGPPPEPAPPAPPAAPAPPVTTDDISSNALAPAPPVPGGPATPEEEAAAAADEGPREGTYDAQAMERCRMALEQIQQGTETLNFYREVFMKYAAVEEVDDLADYGAMLGELARAASEEGEEGEQ